MQTKYICPNFICCDVNFRCKHARPHLKMSHCKGVLCKSNMVSAYFDFDDVNCLCIPIDDEDSDGLHTN